jgi:hypothetical protein
MEVHHHAHSSDPGLHRGKKKWTHYFWEFLMLFLAVFAGFLAENEREHYVEDQRAKRLAKNLYKEIYADSIAVQQKINIRNTKEKECAYFINYVRDSNLATLSDRFYPAFTWTFLQSAQLLFEPNDGVLSQLRNSGELRYFKSNELQTAIGKLSVSISNIRSRNEKEYGFIEFYLRPFSIKHYDFSWYEQFTQKGQTPLIEAPNKNNATLFSRQILNISEFKRTEAENTASYYLLMLRGTRQTHYMPYSLLNHQLLEILRKEFHLE